MQDVKESKKAEMYQILDTTIAENLHIGEGAQYCEACKKWTTIVLEFRQLGSNPNCKLWLALNIIMMFEWYLQ